MKVGLYNNFLCFSFSFLNGMALLCYVKNGDRDEENSIVEMDTQMTEWQEGMSEVHLCLREMTERKIPSIAGIVNGHRGSKLS